MQRRVVEDARTFAAAKREECLGTTGKAPTTFPLNDSTIRQRVLQVAGEGRSTEEQRKGLEATFKQAFADHWAALTK